MALLVFKCFSAGLIAIRRMPPKPLEPQETARPVVATTGQSPDFWFEKPVSTNSTPLMLLQACQFDIEIVVLCDRRILEFTIAPVLSPTRRAARPHIVTRPCYLRHSGLKHPFFLSQVRGML